MERGAPTGFPPSIVFTENRLKFKRATNSSLPLQSRYLFTKETSFISREWGWLVPWEIAGIPVGISQTNELSKRTYNRFTRREPLFPLIFASIEKPPSKERTSLLCLFDVYSGMILFRSVAKIIGKILVG